MPKKGYSSVMEEQRKINKKIKSNPSRYKVESGKKYGYVGGKVTVDLKTGKPILKGAHPKAGDSKKPKKK